MQVFMWMQIPAGIFLRICEQVLNVKTLIHNAELILEDKIVRGYVVVCDGKILKVGCGDAPFREGFNKCVNLNMHYLAPGFIELHSHGAGGADFMDGTVEAFQNACDMHLRHGTTTILPTVLAASREEIERSIDVFRAAKAAIGENGPCLHGLHMEGPYLSKTQCGAIDPKFIRNPQPEEYEFFLEYGKDAIARWTVAAELDGAQRFIRRLQEEGIQTSIGHSDAVYSQVKEAFAAGATHITHLFSAMSTITRRGGFRFSGVLESAFCIPDMTVEVIADGCHVPLELLEMVYRIKGARNTVLTSDSMRCAGQNVTESVLGSLDSGRKVIIEDGVAKLPDRSAFAGSIATDDRLIHTMCCGVGVPLWDAVHMMSLTPARVMGIDQAKGSIAAGKDADLVCFDDQISVLGVMVGGKGLAGCLAV